MSKAVLLVVVGLLIVLDAREEEEQGSGEKEVMMNTRHKGITVTSSGWCIPEQSRDALDQ